MFNPEYNFYLFHATVVNLSAKIALIKERSEALYLCDSLKMSVAFLFSEIKSIKRRSNLGKFSTNSQHNRLNISTGLLKL